jgi:hypothetical protein
MATLSIDLNEAIDPVQPKIGQHKAIFSDFDFGRNKADTTDMCTFGFTLTDDDPDRPGLPFNYYLTVPGDEIVEDFKAWTVAGRPKKWNDFILKDGRHRMQMMATRFKKMSTALGGPESGALDPAIFGKYLGTVVTLNLVPEKEQGTQQLTGRVVIGFDGVSPA